VQGITSVSVCICICLGPKSHPAMAIVASATSRTILFKCPVQLSHRFTHSWSCLARRALATLCHLCGVARCGGLCTSLIRLASPQCAVSNCSNSCKEKAALALLIEACSTTTIQRLLELCGDPPPSAVCSYAGRKLSLRVKHTSTTL